MVNWKSTPQKAWVELILPQTKNPKWIEDSKDISKEIQLSKRELFTLIILAHMYNNNDVTQSWFIGYDSTDSEPNDGYVSNGETKIHIEHKVVAQMDSREALDAIIKTYEKYASKGSGYGENRVMIIQPNKGSKHGEAIRISDLRDKIDGDSPFDKVLTLSLITRKGDGDRIAVMNITEHYPREGATTSGKWMSQVNFDLFTGEADVPHKGID